MMNSNKCFSLTIYVVLHLFLVGCGGGDSSSPGGDGGESPVVYHGLTGGAVLDETNSREITTAGLEDSLGPFDVFVGQSQSKIAIDNDTFTRREAIQTLAQQVDENIQASSSAIFSTSYAAVSSGANLGGCGGSLANRISHDDVLMTFSGPVDYEDYCSQDFTLNGTLNIRGSYYEDGGVKVVKNIVIEYASFSIAAGQQKYTLKGTIHYDNSLEGPYLRSLPILHNVIMDLLLRDDISTKVYRYDNIKIEYSKGGFNDPLPEASTIVVSGRFYHPDHGYVDISTPTFGKIRLLGTDLWPYYGYLEFYGTNNTWANLRLDGGKRNLSIDTDGDGYNMDVHEESYVQVSRTDPGGSILPVANAGEDIISRKTPDAGIGIILNGGQSYDPKGGDLTYNWSFDYCRPGPCPELIDPFTSSPYFYLQAGESYRLVLEVHDQMNLRDVDLITINAPFQIIFYPPVIISP